MEGVREGGIEEEREGEREREGRKERGREEERVGEREEMCINSIIC